MSLVSLRRRRSRWNLLAAAGLLSLAAWGVEEGKKSSPSPVSRETRDQKPISRETRDQKPISRDTRDPKTDQKLILIGEIKGTINPATDDYLIAAIRRAERQGAQALIIKLDTPGGLLTSTHTMAQAMDQSGVPVVFFVTPAGAAATSAGALLMLSSHVAAMTPGSHMGSAHPVLGDGKDVPGDMKAKAVNDTVAFAQSMADLRGRDRELAAQIVAQSKSFTAKEAYEKKLIEILASDEVDLVAQLNGRKVSVKSGKSVTLETSNVRVERAEMSIGQKLLHVVSNPNIAAILATLGMLLIYMELQSPGIQIAGGLGVVFLIVSFMSFQTLPIRVGALALMALGLALMIGEIFATTHGAMAIAGVVSFILGLIWVVDPSQISQGVSPAVWIPAAIALGTGALMIGWVASRMKARSALARVQMKGGGQGGLEGYEARVEALDGSALRSPFGKVMIRGELWAFVADEGVAVGERVQVEKVEGLKLKVRKV